MSRQRAMRVLIDIVHPADVLFFLWPIRKLQSRGSKILVLSRYKDVACELLDEFGIEHQPVTRARYGLVGLARELLERDMAVLRAVRRFSPDVMVGFGGVSISHIGYATGVPAISFYDTDIATLQSLVTNPFISWVYVPVGYRGCLPKGRWSHFPGTKELSYLHPDNFVADHAIAAALGIDSSRPNILVRVVGWQSNHDLGVAGWDDQQLRKLVELLSPLAVLHLSSERPLSDDLERLRYRGPVNQLHHLMGFCALYVGESATMAAEAAVLGVPAIFVGADDRCYLRLLEQAGLLLRCKSRDVDVLARMVGSALADSTALWHQKHKAFLEASSSLAEFVADRISEWGTGNAS